MWWNSIMKERFNLDVDFIEGNILYKETITNKIEAVGHFEPLRHYSEVLFLHRGLIVDISNQGAVQQRFRFDPKIVTGFPLALGVGD